MSTTSISRRYARALFELEQEGVAIAGPLKMAAKVAGVAEVAALLDQPEIPAAVKASVIDKAGKGLGKEVNRLVGMLCERGKASLLPEINVLFEDSLRQATRAVEAELVSATPLDKATQSKIATALSKETGLKVSVKVSEDKDILGGLIVRLGDRQIDHSLRSRLEGLKRVMVS